MPTASEGDTVKVHYTGKLEDGTVFDTSAEREPLEFTLGEGQLIPGFEQAVEGMDVGETKTVNIASDEAYGPRREDLVSQVSKDEFPDEVEPQVNQQFRVNQEDGNSFIVRVSDVQDEEVTLDANHPLAGQDLVFDIELVEIK